MKTMISILMISTALFFARCTDADMEDNGPGMPGEENPGGEWLIPENEVRDGGPGKDGIPAINNPSFIKASEVTYLNDNDLVLGFADGDDLRAYPHKILDWHEIINDDTPNHSMAVIYCPLTGTGIGWDREINGMKTTFGVSGLLYNSNIIPYDRATNSNWSQLLLKSVNGNRKGTDAKTFNLLETSWKTWKAMYPNSKIISAKTGYNRSYNTYPYGNYKSNTNLLFPVSNSDMRLHPKKRMLAIINDGKAAGFTFNEAASGITVQQAGFDNKSYVVASNFEANFMVAFNAVLNDGTKLSFSAVPNQLPIILEDDEGNNWDVFGRAVSGPREGQKLVPVPQMMGYWFAFAAFYPDIHLESF